MHSKESFLDTCKKIGTPTHYLWYKNTTRHYKPREKEANKTMGQFLAINLDQLLTYAIQNVGPAFDSTT